MRFLRRQLGRRSRVREEGHVGILTGKEERMEHVSWKCGVKQEGWEG